MIGPCPAACDCDRCRVRTERAALRSLAARDSRMTWEQLRALAATGVTVDDLDLTRRTR